MSNSLREQIGALTVGELRKHIETVPDDMPLFLGMWPDKKQTVAICFTSDSPDIGLDLHKIKDDPNKYMAIFAHNFD